MPLNDLKCRSAKQKAKAYKIYDSEGLYLDVRPSGTKFWRLKYRIKGNDKSYTIGIYPSVSLSQARLIRSELRLGIKKGIDPAPEKNNGVKTENLIAELSFEDLAKEWHEKNFANWSPRHAKTIMYRLEKYIFPDLQHSPVTSIKPVSMLNCLRKIEVTAPEMTRRVKQYCSKIFQYGIATDQVSNDPTYGLDAALKKYRKGHFASIEVDELPAFLERLYNSQHKFSRQTFLAIRLMLLTFVRTRELVEAKWQEIDFDKTQWVIPAERMKMKRDHVIPLSIQAIKILEEQKLNSSGREFIFPSLPYPRKPMSKGTILMALRRMGYERRMTGHGFRSLALGVLKERLGYSHEVADRQLAHAPKSSVDRAYDRAQFLPQRIGMMQKYADYIEKLCWPTSQKSRVLTNNFKEGF
ncbi:MAG: tyrosine-type recombinase/integrase [Bacteroidetes bacterium]|nr:tyrosine-type recombinase/integrase [Bacteroidota bacterium]